MDEANSVLYVSTILTVVALVIARFFPLRERLLVFGAWLAHLGCAFIQAWIYLYHYGGGDFVVYSRKGAELGAALRQSSELWPDVLRLIFLMESRLPIDVLGAGTTTGAMSGLTSLVCYFVGGETYTCCVVFSFVAFVGCLLLFLSFRDLVPGMSRFETFAIACFVPSVVFWSSAPLKESVAICGLGTSLLGIKKVFVEHRVSYVAAILAGVIVIVISKPYIVMAEAAGLLTWVWIASSERRKSALVPNVLVLVFVGGAVALGLAALGGMFEKFAIDQVLDAAVEQQGASARVEGGSNYAVAQNVGSGFVERLLLIPFALATALFRPFFFEPRNVLMAVNSVETTYVLWLALSAAWYGGRERGRIRAVLAIPAVGFALAFSLVLGIGVGLSTANMGTLSRYRMPLMPFWLLFLSALRTHRKGKPASFRPMPFHAAP